ncbi:MAG: hypothetical protein JSR59_09380 [Proteobacteria bacterium]|nr:hypothetical protein [Pseudomonadota bacterium]
MASPSDASTLTLIEQAMQHAGAAVPHRRVAPPEQALAALIARSVPIEPLPGDTRRRPRTLLMIVPGVVLGAAAAVGILLGRVPSGSPLRPVASSRLVAASSTTARSPAIEHPATMPPAALAASPIAMALPAANSTAAAAARRPPAPAVPAPLAGQLVLRCNAQGRVTYTDIRGSCADGAGEQVTVYPTRGVERFR